jgi:hypothetical protein
MAWALQAVRHGLSQEQIEHEILNSRDLSKKGPPLRRLAYAERTARKAGALSAQEKEGSLWRTRHERSGKNGRLHYLRRKSSTNRKLDEVPLVGRFRNFSLDVLWRILARRQRTPGREGRLESE